MELLRFIAQLGARNVTDAVRMLLDIFLVAFLFYQIISMLKNTRAAQVVVGLVVIFFAYFLASYFQLDTLYWLISKFYASFIIIVVILFQEDIRRLLSRFGGGPFVSEVDVYSTEHVIQEVVSAVKHLSHERIGALIVFERFNSLERLYEHAVGIDAIVTEQLLTAIFQSFSPLHDGAVIIHKNRIWCASVHLPLSKNTIVAGKRLGTRHSAAVGVSEQTDALVIVVSEETGIISLALNGRLERISADALKARLEDILMPKKESSSWYARQLEERLFIPLNRQWLKFRYWSQGGERRFQGTERRKNPNRRFVGAWDKFIESYKNTSQLPSERVPLVLRFPGFKYQTLRTAGFDPHFSQSHENSDKLLSGGDEPFPKKEPLEKFLVASDKETLKDKAFVAEELTAEVQNDNERLLPPETPQPPPFQIEVGRSILDIPETDDGAHGVNTESSKTCSLSSRVKSGHDEEEEK